MYNKYILTAMLYITTIFSVGNSMLDIKIYAAENADHSSGDFELDEILDQQKLDELRNMDHIGDKSASSIGHMFGEDLIDLSKEISSAELGRSIPSLGSYITKYVPKISSIHVSMRDRLRKFKLHEEEKLQIRNLKIFLCSSSVAKQLVL